MFKPLLRHKISCSFLSFSLHSSSPTFKLLSMASNCRNLPSGGGHDPRPNGGFSVDGKRAESPPTFIRGKHQKEQNGKVADLRILKMRVRESFTHGEGISTLRTRHKRRQPLIKCANHDLNIIYFPFLYFFLPFLGFMFFTFLGSTRVFPLLLRITQLR